MTDNEIIKALEHEISRVEYVDGFCADGVDIDLIRNALALINRQNAKIIERQKAVIEENRNRRAERLQEENKDLRLLCEEISKETLRLRDKLREVCRELNKKVAADSIRKDEK